MAADRERLLKRSQARAAAQALLDSRQPQAPPAVLVDSLTLESPVRWAFAYQSVAFLASGDYRDQLVGNGPILVEKADGTARFGRSDIPFEEQI